MRGYGYSARPDGTFEIANLAPGDPLVPRARHVILQGEERKTVDLRVPPAKRE